MNERQRRIVQLLGSLHDHLPSPPGSLRTTSGLTAAERVPCPTCGSGDDRGWVTDRFKRRTPCQACGGKTYPSGRDQNWTRKDAGRGWVSVDPMDADRRPVQTVTEAAPPTRLPRMVGCDACGGTGAGRWHTDADTLREWREPCQRCNGGGKVSKPNLTEEREVVGEELTPLERRNAAGSYAELEDALTWLPFAFRRAVFVVHVDGAEAAFGVIADDAQLGLGLLDRLMPEPIRVPADVRHAAKRQREHARRLKGLGGSREAVAARDREIRKLIRRGRPTQWVAGEFGLSVRQVYRIAQGDADAA